MMRRAGATTVGGLVRVIAFVALLLAALAIRADGPGIAGFVAAGHLLWALNLALDRPRTGPRIPPGVESLVLGSFAAAEAAALGTAWSWDERDLVVWFGVAVSFAAAAIISASRRRPTDGALASQLLFHVLMLVPAAAAAARWVVLRLGGPHVGPALTSPGALARRLVEVAWVGLPVAFTALVAALAYERTRPADRRDPTWSALMAHQVAYLVLALRWSMAGD